MNNPTPHTLEQCNSREEIEAWLVELIPSAAWSIHAALARMEARAAAPLREAQAEIERLRMALRAFKLLYIPVSTKLNPRGWDWYYRVDGDLEGVLLYVREQVEAALASNPAPATEGSDA